MTENTDKLLETKQFNHSNSFKKHQKLAEITYHNNQDSNYTERIEVLDSLFNYKSNQEYYWGPPELSLFFGTLLYEQASPSQKLALNHLYWVTQYNQTAATEANAILYNQVTEGVFSALGGYHTLCRELSLETTQEHHHIHAFHAVGYKTKKSLFGVGSLKKNHQPTNHHKSSWILANLPNDNWEQIQKNTFHLMRKKLLGNSSKIYSEYLQKLEQSGESLPIQTTGLLGQVVPSSLSKLMTLNFGTSPFLACFFYVTRYLANILLKNYEYRYSQYYRKLKQKEDFIPIPTAISHYHLLDESFHTTTSQLIAQDLYKDFAQPTLYERLVANTMLYRGQSLMLSGLSGVMPATFRNDSAFIQPLYRILRSSIFEMSHQESLFWLEKCLCHEHEGFHLNLKSHQHLLTNLRQAFDSLDYLWSVNRELSVMASANSIAKTLKNNCQSFRQFTRMVALDHQ